MYTHTCITPPPPHTHTHKYTHTSVCILCAVFSFVGLFFVENQTKLVHLTNCWPCFWLMLILTWNLPVSTNPMMNSNLYVLVLHFIFTRHPNSSAPPPPTPTPLPTNLLNSCTLELFQTQRQHQENFRGRVVRKWLFSKPVAIGTLLNWRQVTGDSASWVTHKV